jgi:hypothetical protein
LKENTFGKNVATLMMGTGASECINPTVFKREILEYLKTYLD